MAYYITIKEKKWNNQLEKKPKYFQLEVIIIAKLHIYILFVDFWI